MSKGSKKALVPKLRFPEFKETGDWIRHPMGEIFEFQANNSLSRDKLNYEYGVVRNIHYGDIHTKFQTLFRLRNEHVPFISDVEFSQKVRPESFCAEGDIIFADASEDLQDIGKCIEIIDLDGEKVLSGLHTILARPQRDKFQIGFCGYLFKSAAVRSQIQREAQGAKVLGISAKKISKIELLFPKNKAEQKKIADCLSSLDDLISVQSEKITALKTYKKGLLQQLFPQEGETVPRLRFPEFRKDGEWKKYSINDLIEKGVLFPPQDGNHGEIHPKAEDYVQTGIPFIMANNVRNGRIDFTTCNYITRAQADSLRKGFSKEGDVLLTHKGTVGEVAIVPKSEFPYVMLTPQVTYYRVKDKTQLHNCFLATAFISPAHQKSLQIVSGGGTRAYIGITEQRKLMINIPPRLKEQEKIAACVSVINEVISSNIDWLEYLKDHKKGLLQQLFPSLAEGADE